MEYMSQVLHLWVHKWIKIYGIFWPVQRQLYSGRVCFLILVLIYPHSMSFSWRYNSYIHDESWWTEKIVDDRDLSETSYLTLGSAIVVILNFYWVLAFFGGELRCLPMAEFTLMKIGTLAFCQNNYCSYWTWLCIEFSHWRWWFSIVM